MCIGLLCQLQACRWSHESNQTKPHSSGRCHRGLHNQLRQSLKLPWPGLLGGKTVSVISQEHKTIAVTCLACCHWASHTSAQQDLPSGEQSRPAGF